MVKKRERVSLKRERGRKMCHNHVVQRSNRKFSALFFPLTYLVAHDVEKM